MQTPPIVSAEVERVKEQTGWTMPWYTITDAFDADFGVDEWYGKPWTAPSPPCLSSTPRPMETYPTPSFCWTGR